MHSKRQQGKPHRLKFPGNIACVPTVETTHRAYWDVATAFSLIVNLILVGVVHRMAITDQES